MPNCQGLDPQVKNSMSYQRLPNATADDVVSGSRSRIGPDDPADAEVNKFPFAQGLNENAMIANKERVFMHRPDTWVSKFGRASQNYRRFK
jgi:hypothetical protein